ncbi:hypothetical protein C8R45DRAFT_975103 [Mycena sanguinolenta]|nr:hypothetical protein C8R45DRAFT_975103 [Mycena sanguinolenta]
MVDFYALCILIRWQKNKNKPSIHAFSMRLLCFDGVTLSQMSVPGVEYTYVHRICRTVLLPTSTTSPLAQILSAPDMIEFAVDALKIAGFGVFWVVDQLPYKKTHDGKKILSRGHNTLGANLGVIPPEVSSLLLVRYDDLNKKYTAIEIKGVKLIECLRDHCLFKKIGETRKLHHASKRFKADVKKISEQARNEKMHDIVATQLKNKLHRTVDPEKQNSDGSGSQNQSVSAPINNQVENAMTIPNLTQNTEVPEISVGKTPGGLYKLCATMAPTDSNHTCLSQFVARWAQSECINTDKIMISDSNGSVSEHQPASAATASVSSQLEAFDLSFQSLDSEDTDSVLELFHFDDDSSVVLVPMAPEELEKLNSGVEKLGIKEPS